MLYVYLDESGDFEFSNGGSKYFIITALSICRPFKATLSLLDLKHDLWETGLQIESFHASEDKQHVRDSVFEIIRRNLSYYKVDSIVVEKRKTFPALQKDTSRFYQTVFKILLKYVLGGSVKSHSDITFVTDSIPLKKKKKEIEKALKIELAEWSSILGGTYQIFHFPSKTETNLQIVDYIGWAISRKWSRNDTRSFQLINGCIKTEFDVFQMGNRFFY